MKTCAFYTLGCKVNQYETESIREDFIKAGYAESDFNKPCDVYVINTCTVTEKTDKESRRLIRKAHRENPRAKVVVTGCYAELDRDEISAIPGTSFVIRNKDKARILDIIDKTLPIPGPRFKQKKYFDLSISDFKGRSKAFLKIQDGCNNFCSYCKVPLVRGHSESRGEKAILAEAGRLVKKGFQEIILTGICLGAWGEELTPKKRLSDLIKKIIAIKGDFRVRLSSIEPKYVDNRLLDVIKSSPKICKHLHIPLQSGDDNVLKMMNRPYTFAGYAKIIQNARHKIPDIAITTDILVGFPSETDKGFRNTLKLIRKIRPSRIHIFPYSRRKGTAAANIPHGVPKGTVLGRMKAVRLLQDRYSYEYRKRFMGKKAEVLVETARDTKTGHLKGYDDKYINITVNGPFPKGGKKRGAGLVTVRIKKVDKDRTFGAII